MNIVLIAIVIIHGLIHLLGFLDSFEIVEINAISNYISKTEGIFWLITSLLFIATGILIFYDNPYWWLIGIISVLLSQGLIFYSWEDTRFGSIPNFIILLSSIIMYANFNFTTQAHRDKQRIFSELEPAESSLITIDQIKNLPEPVSNWLIKIGVEGTENIRTAHYKYAASMKMRPDSDDWIETIADQYVNIEEPSFVWTVQMQMNKFINITGKDKYENGKASMEIKALSLYPIVGLRENEKLDTATLQRFLGEIVFYPTAALSRHIQWEKINETSVRAKMNYKGRMGEGIFHFDNMGNFVKYSAMRYKDPENDISTTEWVIDVQENKEMNGIIIPSQMTVSWNLPDGQWTWLKMEILEVENNVHLY